MNFQMNLEWITAITILLCGLITVTRSNPIYAALWLINCFLFTAVLFVIQGSVFMGFLQVLTYVGAIIVLVLFTIMLMDLRGDQEGPPVRKIPIRIFAFACALGSFLLLARFFCDNSVDFGPLPEGNLQGVGGVWGGLRHIGSYLFTAGGFFPFEYITVLLLSTLIGCVDLCKKRLP